jgi:uncharacterized protein DUF6596/sigma-70-like protein
VKNPRRRCRIGREAFVAGVRGGPNGPTKLTLRMVGGLTVSEIARAFLVPEATMGQRITRAKGKIKAAKIPYRVPFSEDLPARISGVLAVLFLVFNEGYLASDPGKEPVRSDLTLEAIRLTRLLQALLPSDGAVAGLVALMLLTEALRSARVSASGELVTLDEQDRGGWDAALIAEGTHWSGSGSPPFPQVRDTLAATRSWLPSTRYTPPPGTYATPTGPRSSPSTTSSPASTPHRSWRSIGPSRSPSSTGPRWRWRWSTGWTWAATTPTTPPAPTCYADSAARRMPALRTRRPSSWQATPPRSRTSLAGATSSGPVEPV